SVYGLHSQAIAWQGLRSMGLVWAESGHLQLAARSRRLASRLEAGLRAAVRASQVRLPDGSLFLPVRLLDRERPYDTLTASRAGSYWNLVAPYALASGLFAPRSPQAEGALEYVLRHGSRLLGLVLASRRASGSVWPAPRRASGRSPARSARPRATSASRSTSRPAGRSGRSACGCGSRAERGSRASRSTADLTLASTARPGRSS